MEEQLMEFIRKKLLLRADVVRLDANAPLLGGILDSMSILRLVAFIEERFGISIEDQDLVPENFENIKALAAFVQRLQAAVTPAGIRSSH
jgi:acyl carrier protein